MALIPCPHCGHQVSDRAAACPRCRRPVVQRERDERARTSSPAIPGKEQNQNGSSAGPKIGYGTVALILLVVAFGAIGRCNARRTTSQPINSSAESADAPRDARGQTTFAYWCHVKTILSSHQFPPNAATQEVISRLRAVGRSIQQIPTLGVDDEAVDYAQTVAEAFDQIANLAESNSSIGKMAEYFMRGLNGDVIGGVQETNEQSEQVTQCLRNAENKGNRVRALLTSRYGVEFPQPW